MGFKILAINPGSTSTKVALYDEERPSLDLTPVSYTHLTLPTILRV